MLDALPRTAFSVLAGSATLRRLATRYGLRPPDGFARRFVAGETLGEASTIARALERVGLSVTLDVLGARAETSERAAEATRVCVAMIAELSQDGVHRHLALRLSELGLDVDRATSIDHLRRILDAAAAVNYFVRIDLEGADYADDVLDAFTALWHIGYRNVGVIVQAGLRRSTDDVAHLNAAGVSIRLIDGPSHEPRAVAYQQRSEADAAFVDLMRTLLRHGSAPALGTADPALLNEIRMFAQASKIESDRFELVLPYGACGDLRAMLASGGHRVRISVPFGQEWFPYVMRKLGERPKDVGGVVKSFFGHSLSH